MHPSALLLLWTVGALGTQHISHPLTYLLVAPLFLQRGAFSHWLAFLKRTRILLLSLWLILAYHTPGEALAGSDWAPTYEGVVEANLHAFRLIVLLACVAWLFLRLGHSGLVAALWGLLRPLMAWGLDAERLVVRLSLVLVHLEKPLPKGAWRRILQGSADPVAGRQTILVNVPPLAWRDLALPLAASMVLIVGVNG